MANSSTPIRIDEDLLDAAKVVGGQQSRSAAQQITHWALIGREIEASRTITMSAIVDVLNGTRSYDEIDAEDQALVRVAWADRVAGRLRDLDLAEVFNAEGRSSWIDIDPDGNVIERFPSDHR